MKCDGKCGLMAIETRTQIVMVWNYVMSITKNLCRPCAREWDKTNAEGRAA